MTTTGTKFSAITASPVTPALTDRVVGVTSTGTDYLYTVQQIKSATTNTPSLTDFGAVGNGIADDTAAIAAAFASGASSLLVPPGTYNSTAPIVPANTLRWLFGGGQFSYTGADGVDFFVLTDYSGPGLRIQDIGFDVNNLTYTNTDSIGIYGSTRNVLVDRCRFPRMGVFGITSATTGGGTPGEIIIRDSLFGEAHGSAIYMFECDDLHIYGNKFNFNRTNTNLGVYVQKGKRIIISENRVDRTLTQGIGVSNAKGLAIIGNVVTNSYADAIHVDSANDTTEDFVVADNVISSPDLASTDLGISIFSTGTGGIIQRGLVCGNQISKVGTIGIFISTNNSNAIVDLVSLIGNRIDNPNQILSSFPGIGIAYGGGTSLIHRCMAVGNTIASTDGNMGTGLLESPGNVEKNHFLNNIVMGATVAAATVNGTGSTQAGNSSLPA